MKIDGATIAVIGGTGFIGRMIVEALAVRGAQIKVLARNPDRAKFLKPMGQVGQISIHGGDALDDAALDEVMDGADAVVNTIGILAEPVASVLTACKPNCRHGSRPRRLASGLNVWSISLPSVLIPARGYSMRPQKDAVRTG